MKTVTRKAQVCHWAAAFVLFGTASVGHSTPIPVAETQSSITITAVINGAGILASPDALVYVTTNTYATSVTNGQLHVATASANAVAAPSLISGANASGPMDIATFRIKQTTLAKAAGANPLFARSAAISTAGISGVRIKSGSSPPNLDLTWDIESLGLRAEPTVSFSLIGQTVTVVQSPTQAILSEGGTSGANIPVTSLEFVPIAEDGEVVSSLGTQILAGPTRFRVSVPLLASTSEFGADPQDFDLSVEVTQFGYSAEAPPAATTRVAEQVGATTDSAGMHWDADSGTLTFDQLPINILADGPAETIGSMYADDPLAGAYFVIDPLTFAGEMGETVFLRRRAVASQHNRRDPFRGEPSYSRVRRLALFHPGLQFICAYLEHIPGRFDRLLLAARLRCAQYVGLPLPARAVRRIQRPPW